MVFFPFTFFIGKFHVFGRKKHHFHATTKSKVPVEVIQEIRNAEVGGEKRSEVKKRYPELDANAFTRIWDGITAAHIIGKVGN